MIVRGKKRDRTFNHKGSYEVKIKRLGTKIIYKYISDYNMGDSDDERDYRRRDKFHNERRGYDGGDRFGDDYQPRPLPPPTYASGYRLESGVYIYIYIGNSSLTGWGWKKDVENV